MTDDDLAERAELIRDACEDFMASRVSLGFLLSEIETVLPDLHHANADEERMIGGEVS